MLYLSILFLSLFNFCLTKSQNPLNGKDTFVDDSIKDDLELKKESRNEPQSNSNALYSYGLRSDLITLTDEDPEAVHDAVSAIVKREAYLPRRPIQRYRLGDKRISGGNNETDDGTRTRKRKRVKNRNKESNSQETNSNSSALPLKSDKKEIIENIKPKVFSTAVDNKPLRERVVHNKRPFKNNSGIKHNDTESRILRNPHKKREQYSLPNVKNKYNKYKYKSNSNSSSKFMQSEKPFESVPTEKTEKLENKTYNYKENPPYSGSSFFSQTQGMHSEILGNSSSQQSSGLPPTYSKYVSPNVDHTEEFKIRGEIGQENDSFYSHPNTNLENNYQSLPNTGSKHNDLSHSLENKEDSYYPKQEHLKVFEDQVDNDRSVQLNRFENHNNEYISPQQRELNPFSEFGTPNIREKYNTDTGYNMPKKQRYRSKPPQQEYLTNEKPNINKRTPVNQDYSLNTEFNIPNNAGNIYNLNQQENPMNVLSSSKPQDNYNINIDHNINEHHGTEYDSNTQDYPLIESSLPKSKDFTYGQNTRLNIDENQGTNNDHPQPDYTQPKARRFYNSNADSNIPNSQENIYSPNQRGSSLAYGLNEENDYAEQYGNRGNSDHPSSNDDTEKFTESNAQHLENYESRNRYSNNLSPSRINKVKSRRPTFTYTEKTQYPTKSNHDIDSVQNFNYEKLPKETNLNQYEQLNMFSPQQIVPERSKNHSKHKSEETIEAFTPNSHLLRGYEISPPLEENFKNEEKSNIPLHPKTYDTESYVSPQDYDEVQEVQYEDVYPEVNSGSVYEKTNPEYNKKTQEQDIYSDDEKLNEQHFNTGNSGYNPVLQSFNGPASLNYPYLSHQETQEDLPETSNYSTLPFEQQYDAINTSEQPKNQKPQYVEQEIHQRPEIYQHPQQKQQQQQHYQSPQDNFVPKEGNYINNNIFFRSVNNPREETSQITSFGEEYQTPLKEHSYNPYNANQKYFENSELSQSNNNYDQFDEITEPTSPNYDKQTGKANLNLQHSSIYRNPPQEKNNYNTNQNEYQQKQNDETRPYYQEESEDAEQVQNPRFSPKTTKNNLDTKQYQPESNIEDNSYFHGGIQDQNPIPYRKPTPKANNNIDTRQNEYQSNAHKEASPYSQGQGKENEANYATANIQFNLNYPFAFKNE